MDLAEFDQALEAARQGLLHQYESDRRRPWLEYMYGEALHHRKRLAYTMDLVDGVRGRALDVGANAVFSCMASLRREIPIEMINYGTPGAVEWVFGDRAAMMSLLDIQRDPFPHADATFDAVLFFEVLEHLSIDPMRTMAEINRVTRPGGMLLLSTPNIISYRSIAAAIDGRHPHLSSQFLPGDSTDRHNREYTPAEIAELVESSGYKVDWIGTPSVYSEVREFAALAESLRESNRGETMRGDTIAVRAIKTGPVSVRHPGFLYFT
jgi:SAM-dependent methyltransferase